MKKILSIILSLFITLNMCLPACALEVDNVTVEEVDHAMNTVSNSLLSLNDTASSSEVGTLASIFNSFMDIARNTGSIVTTVNGSVTFLRLIGILSDPTQDKLSGIMEQLQVIDEKLSSMDDKLNDLTTMMSEIKASVEFNARTEKAILYESSWRDFEYRYMEDSMDKLISKYNSMLRSGLLEWCNGQRNINNVDNSKIIVLYDKEDEQFTLTYSDYNGIPTNISEDDAWIIIPSTCLPSSFSYNANTFNEDLEKDIAKRINDLIDDEDLSSIEIHNYPLSLSSNKEEVDALAKDIVNTLVFRVASSKVNSDENFAGEVSRQFTNFCSHVQGSGDGLDAALKTFYLTHAFEYSIKDDLKDFCDRMIIITGTYGLFTSNVLGMSHLTTDSEKVAAVNQMTAAIKMEEEAKKNCVTGNDNFCYITGSILKYTTVTYTSFAELVAHYTMSNTTYKSYKAVAPYATYKNASLDESVPAGDVAMIMIASTLLSNGIKPTHDYFNEKLGNGSVENLGNIVTGYSGVSTFTIDGKTTLHVKNAFGDYFKNNSTITSLPEDAESEYVVYRKKISGSLYDLTSGTLSSNATLCAIGVYGENHAYWFTDEGGFMGGPSNNSSFKDEYSVAKTGEDMTGVIRTHSYKMSNSYNILLSTPCESLGLQEGNEYNPLKSLENDVPPYEYNESIYEEEKPEVDFEKSDVTLSGTKLQATYTKGSTRDCVVYIYDEFSNQTKAELLDSNGNKQTDCLVEKGSIKVTVPNDYLKTLDVGTHDFKLHITSIEGIEYSYDIEFVINRDNSGYQIVNTSVK